MKSFFRWFGRLVLLVALVSAVTVGFLLPDDVIDEWRGRLGLASSSEAKQADQEHVSASPDAAAEIVPQRPDAAAVALREPATEVPPYWQKQGEQAQESAAEMSYDASRYRPQTPAAPETAERDAIAPAPEAREASDWSNPEPVAAMENYNFRPLDGSVASSPPAQGSAPASAAADERDQVLSEARRAYWKGELDRAIGYYRQLTQDYPEEPDFFGELGNVFREQGEMDLAAKAYYDAAVLLVQRGEQERARGLAEAISRLSTAYEEQLQELLGDQRTLGAAAQR